MAQSKTETVSYKNHKQVTKLESEWIKAENTHAPLISQETWEAVQWMGNHPACGRSSKSGMTALFGELLRCTDCGSSMRHMRDYRKKVSDKEPEYKAYFAKRDGKAMPDNLYRWDYKSIAAGYGFVKR